MKTSSVLSAICAALVGVADCAPTGQGLQAREGSSWMDAYSLPNFAGFHKRYEVPHGQCSKSFLSSSVSRPETQQFPILGPPRGESVACVHACVQKATYADSSRSPVQVDIRTDFPPGTAAGLSSVQNGPRGTTECTLFA